MMDRTSISICLPMMTLRKQWKNYREYTHLKETLAESIENKEGLEESRPERTQDRSGGRTYLSIS